MHIHNWPEHHVNEHPVILDLERSLRAKKFSKDETEFLCRHLHFAYPRTLWFAWEVDLEDESALKDINQRHRLDPKKTGEFLTAWLTRKPSLKNIVFDFTNVVVMDLESMRTLVAATAVRKHGGKYYVCSGEIAEHLRQLPDVDPGAIFPSEKLLLYHLREHPKNQRSVVPMPASLDLLSFDAALRRYASKRRLQGCDIIAFDMRKVKKVSFEAHCMFSPTIHSLAHSYGILATVLNAGKLVNDLTVHGTLRPMRSYLVNVPQTLLRRAEPPEEKGNPLPVHTFTPATPGISDVWMHRLNTIYRYYAAWFADIEHVRRQQKERRFGSSLVYMQNIVHELVTNVMHHSHGLGYVAIELDPEPGKGLDFYVGDTGIGLAKGLQHSYQMKMPSDSQAVVMAMNLGKKLVLRRKLKGTLGYGGRGLAHAGVLLRRLNGTISMRSGSAMATFAPTAGKGRAAVEVNDMYPVQGTHVHIHIPSRWESLQSAQQPIE
jgi:hypothetical protein